ncbi:hypothetical protein M501DRAFT_452286 [Patellaria atrata CBS 101060]|uniref:Uncharacterized protein n=1 Tax=Patellaria atrata CBS 101060 TaxID=1346257 RepID=A0A9P4S331_9PEZI|nr:hypothetical protein M501DRAFT_452286 [Patellaria atrata CBS 101060]
MKAMEEHDEAPSFRASTNIYLTFKTIQLLNQLRRKFRTRVRSTRLQTKVDLLGNDLRQDIAVETINGVEKLLSSDLSELESKQRRGESNRIFKSRKDDRQLIHRRLKGLLFKNDNRKDKGLNCAFSQLASLLGCSTHSLAQIASDDKLFLQSMGINRFTSFTRTHIASYLPLVESALHCIWRSASGARGARRLLHLENGLTQTYLMDEKFIANLEHMLFRLRGQLVQSLFDKLLEAVRNDYESWHDYFRNQRKLGENWFAEYADNKRPLSTTWPWSIKPSLAVIWGVCWKFYYPPTDYGGFNPPQHSSEENPAVSQRYFLADGNINWGRPEQNQYLNYELQNLGLENSNYGQEIQGQGQQQLQQPSPVLSQVVDLWAAAGQQQQHTQHSDRYPTFIPSDLDRHSGHFYGKEELYHVKVSNAGHGSLSPLVSSPSQADVSKMVRASNFRLLAPQLIRQPTQRSQSLSES